MGDSRISSYSRGFPEVAVHGALVRRKIFHYYHTHFFILIFVLVMLDKVVIQLGCVLFSPLLTILEIYV